MANRLYTRIFGGFDYEPYLCQSFLSGYLTSSDYGRSKRFFKVAISDSMEFLDVAQCRFLFVVVGEISVRLVKRSASVSVSDKAEDEFIVNVLKTGDYASFNPSSISSSSTLVLQTSSQTPTNYIYISQNDLESFFSRPPQYSIRNFFADGR